MSYVKTTWANGDTITAEKLNHIEDGIENCSEGDGGQQEPLMVTFFYDETLEYDRLDKTFGEIYSAFMAGRLVIVQSESVDESIFNINDYSLIYACGIIENTSSNTFIGRISIFSSGTLDTDLAQTLEDMYDLYPHEYIE